MARAYTDGQPSVSPITNSKAVHTYAMNESGMTQFTNYFWTGDLLGKMVQNSQNVIDNVVSFHYIPISSTPWTSISGNAVPIKIGNITCDGTSTESTSTVAVNGFNTETTNGQYGVLTCGELTIDAQFNNYLDYSPYTEIYLYCPYCDMITLDAQDVMGKTILVEYVIDIFSGNGVCNVSIKIDNAHYEVYKQISCNVMQTIPMSQSNYTASLGSFVGSVATGGSKIGKKLLGLVNGNIDSEDFTNYDLKQTSGMTTTSSNALKNRKPFLLIKRPTISRTSPTLIGKPCYITDVLSHYSGFTKIQECHIENIPCTQAEKDEILQLLKEGVIL